MARPQTLTQRFVAALAGLMALVVVLTNMQMAVGRVQAAAVDRVVICSGYGVMTIELDADGNPVGPVHLCHECLAAKALAHLPAPVMPLVPAPRLLALLPALSPAIDLPQPGPNLPQARGPPTRFL